MINIPHMTEELNRVARCADFRHERILRHEATRFVEEIESARALLNRPGFAVVQPANDLHLITLIALTGALDALVLMRADLDCFDAPLRRPIAENLDDAEDSVRTIYHMLIEAEVEDAVKRKQDETP